MSVTNFLQRPSFPLPVREEIPSLRRFFRRLWMICVGAALLIMLSFVVLESIENRLEGGRTQALVEMNLINRQHTHTQMIVRLVLQSEHGRPSLRQYQLERLRQVWSMMSANQTMLQFAPLPRTHPYTGLPAYR